MRIRHGVTVKMAVDAVDEIRSSSQDARNTLNNQAVHKLNAYLNWVDASQSRLRTIFSDSELEHSLLARGYWHICTAVPDIKTPLGRMINEELNFQVGHPNIHGDMGGRLGKAQQRLIDLQARASRSGHICVTDTNALLHYARFDLIDWKDRLGVPEVRLIIPLAVVDELDNKKYARRAEFQDRARDLLTLIDGYVTAEPPDGYSQLQDGVTVEVMADEEGHDRAPTNDQEIRERCELLQQITGQTVTLVTGDSGVRINACARAINVFKLTDDDLLPRYKVQIEPDVADDASGSQAAR